MKLDQRFLDKMPGVFEVLASLRALYPNKTKIIYDLLYDILFRPGVKDFASLEHVIMSPDIEKKLGDIYDVLDNYSMPRQTAIEVAKKALGKILSVPEPTKSPNPSVVKSPQTTVSINVELEGADKAIEQLERLNKLADQLHQKRTAAMLTDIMNKGISLS